MKFGMRTPSIKKSFSARTTGKIKRELKKSINPLYNKKGMGVINNPQKSIYNKVYNKITFGVSDFIRVPFPAASITDLSIIFSPFWR